LQEIGCVRTKNLLQFEAVLTESLLIKKKSGLLESTHWANSDYLKYLLISIFVGNVSRSGVSHLVVELDPDASHEEKKEDNTENCSRNF